MSNIFQKPPNNYQYVIGVPNYVDIVTTPVTRTGNTGGVVALHSVVIPPNAIGDGQYVRILGVGRANNPTAAGSFTTVLNASTIVNVSRALTVGENGWVQNIELIRHGTSLTTIAWLAMVLNAAGIGVGYTPQCNKGVIANVPFDQTITVTFQINATGAGDTFTQDISHASIF